MDIKTAGCADINGILALWNGACAEGELLHKPLNAEAFAQKFAGSPGYSERYVICAQVDGDIIGFIIGIGQEDSPCGYISMCIVKNEWRRRGIGRALVEELERRFKDEGKREMIVNCTNPVRLDWLIPDTDGHDHNNVPGVDILGKGYPFLLALGYAHTGTEFSYYRTLEGFSQSAGMEEREQLLLQKGVTVEIYDAARHHSLDSFFDDIGVPAFRTDAMSKMEMDPPWPLIVASRGGRVVGFTGPVGVQESGRGWFAGIAVHSDCRGMGVMTVLFNRLLLEFKAAGAAFSTLFTGENNPARKTYERFGFSVVRRWAIMRKEL